MDQILRALADATRRQILALAWRQERTAGDIASKFLVSRPAISQHLGVLVASGLLTVRRSGTRRLYRANRGAIARLRAELGAFWDTSLTRLKTEVETAERKRRRN